MITTTAKANLRKLANEIATNTTFSSAFVYRMLVLINGSEPDVEDIYVKKFIYHTHEIFFNLDRDPQAGLLAIMSATGFM